ncbi:hypothetical protein LY78DRAFT_316227 [Colletotrichum sublineola]|nr:hypothetical protein LY78DRAFT_316227 [Colletotrichum sublineola]
MVSNRHPTTGLRCSKNPTAAAAPGGSQRTDTTSRAVGQNRERGGTRYRLLCVRRCSAYAMPCDAMPGHAEHLRCGPVPNEHKSHSTEETHPSYLERGMGKYALGRRSPKVALELDDNVLAARPSLSVLHLISHMLVSVEDARGSFPIGEKRR